MLCRLAALSLVAIISPGCTTYITQVQAQETGEDDAASSFPASSYPDAEDSSTGDAVEGDSSSTGGDTSTGAPDESTTLAMDSGSSTSGSTGEPIEGSTSDDASSTTGEQPIEEGTSTSGEPIDQTTGGESSSSTGEPEPPPPPPPPVPTVKTGEICAADDECISGWCSGSTIENVMRCTVTCDPLVAVSCQMKEHPGLCTHGGGPTYYCMGVGLPKTPVFFEDIKPGYADAGVMSTPENRKVYLIPAWAAPYTVETAQSLNNGSGPWEYDLINSQGVMLGTYSGGAEKPVIQPQGKYLWVVMRPAPGSEKSFFQLTLKL